MIASNQFHMFVCSHLASHIGMSAKPYKYTHHGAMVVSADITRTIALRSCRGLLAVTPVDQARLHTHKRCYV